MIEQSSDVSGSTSEMLEQALLISESKFRTLAEIAPAAISIFQGERMLFTNDAASAISDYTKEELLAMHPMELVVPEAIPGIRALFEQADREGQSSLRYIHQIKTRQGDTRWIDASVTKVPLIGDNAWLSVLLDITEQQKTKQTLQERETWYGRLVDLLPDAVVIHRQGNVIFLNRSALAILGVDSADEIIGQSAFNFVHPDYRQPAAERIQRLLATGDAAPFVEEKFMRVDGSIIDVEVAAFPFEEHGVTSVQVVIRDITARKRAERTLQQHALRLELLSKIDNASLTAQPMEEIARSALDSLRKLIPCTRATVTLFDTNTDSPTVTILAVESSEPTPDPPGTTYSRIDYRELLLNLGQGKRQVFSDLESIAQTEVIGEVWRKGGAASLVVVPLYIRGELIGSLNLSSDRKDAFQEDHLDIAGEVADRLAVAMQNARFFSEINAANTRLQALSHRLVRVQEEERQSIARELHDEIGQSLTALNLSLQLASHAPPDQIATQIGEAQEMIADLMNRTRELSVILRPAMLDDLGLTPALEWFFERYARQVQIEVDFTYNGLDQGYGADIDIAVFRIIQESLTNVARHAHTNEVKVRLWQVGNTINILIQDEGDGFDVEQTLHQNMSNGLSGMMERVNSLSGSFNIESEPGEGACITVQLPLGKKPAPKQKDPIS